jgi:hypothetical protein
MLAGQRTLLHMRQIPGSKCPKYLRKIKMDIYPARTLTGGHVLYRDSKHKIVTKNMSSNKNMIVIYDHFSNSFTMWYQVNNCGTKFFRINGSLLYPNWICSKDIFGKKKCGQMKFYSHKFYQHVFKCEYELFYELQKKHLHVRNNICSLNLPHAAKKITNDEQTCLIDTAFD